MKDSSNAVQGADVDGVARHRVDLLLDLLGTESVSQDVLGLKELECRNNTIIMSFMSVSRSLGVAKIHNLEGINNHVAFLSLLVTYLLPVCNLRLGVLQRFDGTVDRNNRCILESDLVSLLVADCKNVSVAVNEVQKKVCGQRATPRLLLRVSRYEISREHTDRLQASSCILPSPDLFLTCSIQREHSRQSSVRQTRPFLCQPPRFSSSSCSLTPPSRVCRR